MLKKKNQRGRWQRSDAMIESVYSVSDNLDPLAGVRSVVADCRAQLGGRCPSAGLFFTSCMEADYEQMLAEIHGAFPDIELIGCTTDGEITPERGFTEDSSALLLLVSEDIGFAAAVAENISGKAKEATARAYQQAKSRLGQEPAMALVLPDGMSTMFIPIDAILRSEMGDGLPIFGGSAGDGFQIVKTYQFLGNEVFSDAMVILLLSGELQIGLNVATGPIPYGEYIEDRELSFFPLAVYTGESDDFVLRDPVEVNRKSGSISFVGRIEEPCRVRITQVTRDDTLRSGHSGSRQILSIFEEATPDLILLFSCTSRRHVLGSRTDEEFEVLKRDGRQVPFFGFYCYGEIGPFANGESVHFHSDTCISLALKCSSNG
jgi:hypothetical protein